MVQMLMLHVMLALLSYGQLNIKLKEVSGLLAELVELSLACSVAVVKVLLEHGADADAASEARPPVMWATEVQAE